MRSLVLFSLLLLAACGGDSITNPDADGEASLFGRVTVQSTGRPHYPSSVAILTGGDDFRFDRVDFDGRYQFADVKPGRYTIAVTLGEGAGVREGLRETIDIAPGPNVKDFVLP
jgi:hypothetical protein